MSCRKLNRGEMKFVGVFWCSAVCVVYYIVLYCILLYCVSDWKIFAFLELGR